MKDWQCRLADYACESDCEAIVSLMECYAKDPMGGAEALAPEVVSGLCDALAEQPGAISVIAWDGGQAIGLINAFVGFSTFKAKPLLNIHDIIVRPAWRQRGVCSAMLEHIQTLAQRRGYCKLTLEVLEGNTAARQSYQRFGFVDYQLRPEYGSARFMEKPLEGAINE